MKRVIKDKAKFTKVSKKIIEKDFISMSSMRTMDSRRRYWKNVLFFNF